VSAIEKAIAESRERHAKAAGPGYVYVGHWKERDDAARTWEPRFRDALEVAMSNQRPCHCDPDFNCDTCKTRSRIERLLAGGKDAS
jgi:hypothetical protein